MFFFACQPKWCCSDHFAQLGSSTSGTTRTNRCWYDEDLGLSFCPCSIFRSNNQTKMWQWETLLLIFIDEEPERWCHYTVSVSSPVAAKPSLNGNEPNNRTKEGASRIFLFFLIQWVFVSISSQKTLRPQNISKRSFLCSVKEWALTSCVILPNKFVFSLELLLYTHNITIIHSHIIFVTFFHILHIGLLSDYFCQFKSFDNKNEEFKDS